MCERGLFIICAVKVKKCISLNNLENSLYICAEGTDAYDLLIVNKAVLLYASDSAHNKSLSFEHILRQCRTAAPCSLQIAGVSAVTVIFDF